MRANDRKIAFFRIKEWFAKSDQKLIEKKGSRVFNTQYGIFGPSMLEDAYDLFEKIQLEEKNHFIDLGSGDGRIALVAALFTKSTGIEGNEEVHEIANQAKKALQEDIPELSRCEFLHADYTKNPLEADVFFIYADHKWDPQFEDFLRTKKGVLFSYQNIFPPNTLTKGKTIWVEQTPIVTYELGD